MSNFIFLHPHWLIGLLPVALVLLWLLTRSKNQTLIAPHLAKGMGLEHKTNPSFKLSLVTLAWSLAIVALAGPSFEKQSLPTFNNTHARVLVMDMSRSMYATDNKPNRLTQARYKALDLLKRWQDGYTGLIAYAADAYTISPLTNDTATISNLLPNLSPDIMPYQGSDAAKGVKAAIKMLQDSNNPAGDIVLITDDIDDHEKSAIENLVHDTNWRLSILAMGTPAGAPIPQSDGSLLQDSHGNTVIAHANFNKMKSLANTVGGLFIPMQLNNQDVETITKATKSHLLMGGQMQNQQVKSRIDNGYFLLPLIVIPALMLFRKGLIFLLIVCCYTVLPSQHAYASPWLNQNQEAKRAYDAKDYKQAAQLFTDPEWKGAAQYQAGDYRGAIQSFSQITNPTSDQTYNLANAYAQNQQYKKAISLYNQILKQQPNHADAKHNLKQVENALKQQQQQQQQQKNNQQNKDNPQHKTDQNPSSKHESQKNTTHQQSDQEQQSSQPNTSKNDAKDAKNNKSSDPKTQQAPSSPRSHQSQSSPAEQQKSNQQSNTRPDEAHSQQKSAQQQAQSMDPRQQQDKNAQVAPELRKLEQVQSARDPSRLLRAQILLQAETHPQPKDNGKEW